jgi:D-alanyl-D-alanine carboxypeptidase
MKKLYSYSLFIALLTAISGSLRAQLPSSLENRLAFVLDSVCSKYRIKGASVAVLVPNNGVWKSTYGISHIGQPVTSDMMFDVASNTKTYISALLLKLQETGKVDLDDSIGTWIHNVPNVNGQITIRQCLNHSSGIGDYDGGNVGDTYNDSVFKDFNRIWQPEELLQKFPVTAPKFAPGTGWGYSNTNYVIAGLIIKQIMNQPVSKTFRELFFTPHQLNNTVFFPDDPQAGIPFPHIWSMNTGNGDHLVDFMDAYNYSNTSVITSGFGCGGMVTTAEDNVLFWHKLFSGQIINDESLAEMTTFIKLSGSWKYGLGLYYSSKDINGRVIYEHGGTSLGFITENVVDSASGVCITVLTNQDSIKNDILLDQVVAALHKVTLQMPVTGIKENVYESASLKLYPVPASHVLNIRMNESYNNLLFSVYNLSGEKMLSETFSGTEAAVVIDTLPPGLYIVRVTDEKCALVHTSKLLIAQ